MCTPTSDQSAAPAEGASEVYKAGEAGEVEVSRTSATDLDIAQVTPNGKWTDSVTGQSGPRVKVKFTNSDGPPWVIRFAASMDQAGKMMHIRVSTCE